MRRWIKRALIFITALVVLWVAAFALLGWWLSTQPMKSTLLTPYIESALHRLMPDTKVEISNSLIIWDNTDRSIAFRSDSIKLYDNKQSLIAELPAVKLKLSAVGLLMGRFVPAELAIDHPQLWLTRHSDGTVYFGNMSTNNEAPTAGQISFYYGLQQLATQITNEGLLNDLTIVGTKIFIHDEETQKDWSVTVPEITLQNGHSGLTGQAQIEVVQSDKVSLLQVQYDFKRSDEQHALSVQFKDLNPSFLAGRYPKLASMAMFDLPVGGQIAVTTDGNLNILKTNIQLSGGEGRLVSSEFWDEPRAIKSFTALAEYDRQTHQLSVPSTVLDFGGPKLTLEIEGNPPEESAATANGKTYDMAVTLNVSLSDLPMDQYASIWPKPIIPGAREWISANMSKGLFKQGEASLHGRLAWNDLENMVIDSGSGKVSAGGARVQCLQGMPSVEDVSAEATFDLDHMDVQLTGGGIGSLKLLPSTIKMTDFQKPVQNIVIPLKISGPIRDVIQLLDAPPLGYAKAMGLEADDTAGTVEGTLELSFPLLRSILIKDVGMKADARLANFGTQKLVSGLAISDGNLALNLDKEGFTLKGPVALNKIPANLAWQSYFTPMDQQPLHQATLTSTIDEGQWSQLGVSQVHGPTQLTAHFVQPDKTLSKLSGELDFRQAAIQVDELNWKKAAGAATILKFDAVMPQGKPVEVKTLDLQGENIKAAGTAKLDNSSMRLLALDLEPLQVGRTHANLHFAQSADDKGKLSFSAEGEALDISGSRGDKEPGKTNPRPKEYNLKLKKLYTGDSSFISDISVQAQRDKNGWNQIELHGMAEGTQQLDISLRPLSKDSPQRVFSVTCYNFGKALKGLGFTDTINGGQLSIKGSSSADEPQLIKGKVKIGDFVVSGLPVLARLLSAASPFGFADFVTGNSSFDELEGRFRWQGDEVELVNVRAAGSVYGLNVEGKVNLDGGTANLRGTLVPFSFVNSIIGSIPLLGDMITGGDGGGVIAASYTVKGSLSDPDINVNPASLLTPGFLRNIFFGGDDSDDEYPDTSSSPTTKEKTAPSVRQNFNKR